jgi:NADPH2:quinone reductase
MKAAAYRRTGGPDVLEYVDVPDPEVRPGGVVVAIEAVSIQGGDLLHRSGGVMASDLHVVGYQAAGTVREVGAGVDGLTVGQRVVATMGHGSHAELA